MILLDAFIRFTGVGMLLLLTTLTLRDIKNSHGALYLFLASISVMAAFLGLTIDQLKLPNPAHMIVRFLDIPHLIFIWLFALSLFKSNFALRWFHWVISIIYCLPILIVRLYEFEVIDWEPLPFVYLANIFSIVLMFHLIITTLRGRSDDLLERRRRARIYFVIIITFVAICAVVIEVALINSPNTARQTFWIASIWPAIAWTSCWLLKANNSALIFNEIVSKQQSLNVKEQDLQMKLETIMLSEEAFKLPNLTVVHIAKKMDITQHSLRALINQSLGYQNFNAFVNSYRIAAVKKALRDSNKSHLPILTIAMDCGFNSISPFNRAFKQSEKVTPSEYRHQIEH